MEERRNIGEADINIPAHSAQHKYQLYLFIFNTLMQSVYGSFSLEN